VQVISTNIGEPQEFSFQDRTIRSSMHRRPVPGGIEIGFNQVQGDKFDAEKLHGIRETVVYALSSDFYPDFGSEIQRGMSAGVFGENLTMRSLDEKAIFVGDDYEVGTCRLRVTAPRSPCNRLNFAFQNAGAMQLFIKFNRPGVYFEVLQEGQIRPGDELKLLKSNGAPFSIHDIFQLWKTSREIATGETKLEEVRQRFLEVVEEERVPMFVRAKFQKILFASDAF
jgi:MOSC domain-containing protein YiiM